MSNARLLLAIAIFGAWIPAETIVGQVYTIPWHTIDGGGGPLSSGTFELNGTVGQHDAAEKLTSSTFQLTGGYWPGVPSLYTTYALSLNAILGTHSSGQLVDVEQSDDARLCYISGNPFAPTLPSIWLEFTGQLTNVAPQMLAVDVESQVNDFGITQEISLYNFDTQSFDSFDVRPASRNADGRATVYVIGAANVAPYVEGVNGKVRAKLAYTDGGVGVFASWQACVDQLIFRYR